MWLKGWSTSELSEKEENVGGVDWEIAGVQLGIYY